MKKARGFTLIELLVVISIIALLSSIVLAALGEAKKKAWIARNRLEVQEISKAVNLYSMDHGAPPSPGGLCLHVINTQDACWSLVKSALTTYFSGFPDSACPGSGNCSYLFSYAGPGVIIPAMGLTLGPTDYLIVFQDLINTANDYSKYQIRGYGENY